MQDATPKTSLSSTYSSSLSTSLGSGAARKPSMSKSPSLYDLIGLPLLDFLDCAFMLCNSDSISFTSSSINCSFLRGLPSGQRGVLPFLHTFVILVHSRCDSIPVPKLPRTAP